MKKLFAQTASEPGKTVMVFSSEDVLTTRHPSVCAARLKSLMPGSTVVLVLRNQLTTWPSWYINHGAYLKGVPRRYWRRHVGFAEWLEYCFEFPDQTPVEAMNYKRHMEIFSRIFGADRLKVLLYEDLIGRPADYCSQWGAMLAIPGREVEQCLNGRHERPRLTHRRHLFDRWTSSFPLALLKPFAGSWLESGPPARVELPAGWVGRIRDYYAPGNRAVEAATGLSLSAHGYPV